MSIDTAGAIYNSRGSHAAKVHIKQRLLPGPPKYVKE